MSDDESDAVHEPEHVERPAHLAGGVRTSHMDIEMTQNAPTYVTPQNRFARVLLVLTVLMLVLSSGLLVWTTRNDKRVTDANNTSLRSTVELLQTQLQDLTVAARCRQEFQIAGQNAQLAILAPIADGLKEFLTSRPSPDDRQNLADELARDAANARTALALGTQAGAACQKGEDINATQPGPVGG